VRVIKAISIIKAYFKAKVAQIKQNIALWIARKRFRLNIRHKNKTRLERFRVTTKLVLFDILIATIVWSIFACTFQGRTIVIYSNVAVVEAQAETATPVSLVEPEGPVASEQSVQGSTNDISAMIAQTFPEETKLAVAVAKAESGLNPDTESWIDRTADGRPFSVGLMQINLTWHELDGVKCYEAFQGKNYKAKVINENLYQKCVKLAKDPKINLETAKGIYERSGNHFGAWGAYLAGSHLKFMSVDK